MPTVRRTRPWLTKPPAGTPLNLSHPFALGLTEFWPLNTGIPNGETDLVSGVVGSLGTAPVTLDSSPDGMCYKFNGTNQSFIKALNQTATPAAYTLLARVYPTTVTNAYQTIYAKTTGTPGLFVHNGGMNFYYSGDHTLTPVVNNVWQTIGVTSTPTTLTRIIDNNSASVAAACPWLSNTYYLGSETSGTNYFFGSISWVALWNYAMMPAQIAAIVAPPTAPSPIWQMFQPAKGDWLFEGPSAAPTTKLFRPATLSLGSGGSFFQSEVNS